eukprot:6750675-Alexandrium_andersonii.AAC.1
MAMSPRPTAGAQPPAARAESATTTAAAAATTTTTARAGAVCPSRSRARSPPRLRTPSATPRQEVLTRSTGSPCRPPRR